MICPRGIRRECLRRSQSASQRKITQPRMLSELFLVARGNEDTGSMTRMPPAMILESMRASMVCRRTSGQRNPGQVSRHRQQDIQREAFLELLRQFRADDTHESSAIRSIKV